MRDNQLSGSFCLLFSFVMPSWLLHSHSGIYKHACLACLSQLSYSRQKGVIALELKNLLRCRARTTCAYVFAP
jgi:hypothetical protein